MLTHQDLGGSILPYSVLSFRRDQPYHLQNHNKNYNSVYVFHFGGPHKLCQGGGGTSMTLRHIGMISISSRIEMRIALNFLTNRPHL